MTYPITPDPAVHSYPPGYQSVPRSSGYVKGLAIQLIESLFNQLVQLLTNYLYALPGQIEQIVQSELQGLPGQFSHEAGTFLQALFQGLMPHAFDNLDGTAKPLTGQIVTNLDGTATIVNQLGSTAVNTVVDWADGTAMSMGAALQNVHSYFGTHNYAVQGLSTILGQTGTGTANQLVAALQGVIPAALDNLDGTAAVLGSQIKQNLDGTATYVAQVATQAANQANVTLAQATTGVNGLIDNLDGTAMSFFHAASQGVNNALGGLLHAFTGNPVAGVITTQAQQAQVTSAAAALQQRLATIGNGGEEQVDVEFSAYTNGAIPGIFTALSSNTGTAPTINGGVLTLTNSGGSLDQQLFLYNGTTTLTDYQSITGVWPTLVNGSGNSSPYLLGRSAASGATLIQCVYLPGTGWELIGGANFTVIFTDTFTNGASYSLICGEPATGNLYKFSILKNGAPLPLASVSSGDTSQPAGQLYYIDTGHFSTVGGSNRSCGLGMVPGIFGGTISMSSFLFQDTTQSQPSVQVNTSENYSSATYGDLATISDQVAVNIGTSGMATVFISANEVYVSGSGGNPLLSFAMSGANIQTASDTFSAGSSTQQITSLNGSFLLTGLNPGLTVFKLKYKSSAGTATFAFSNRRIGVVAL